MKDLLSQYLRKLGVASYQDLNDSEKETYRTWEDSLAGRKLTDNDVLGFFAVEEDETINKLIGKNLSDKEDTFLKVKLEFLRKVRFFLKTPELERKMTEANISNLLK